PRRANVCVVAFAADQGCAPFVRQRHTGAEEGFSDLAAAGELRALLGPGRAFTVEHPRRAYVFVVVFGADQAVFPVARKRDARAEDAFSALAAAGQLFALLDEWVDPNRVARAAVVDLQPKGPVGELHVRGQPSAGGVQRAQLPVAQR